MLCSNKLLFLRVGGGGASASGEDAPTLFQVSGVFCDTHSP